MFLASVHRFAVEDFASCLTCQQSCESAQCFVALFVGYGVATIPVEMWIAAWPPLARSSSSTHDNSASTDGSTKRFDDLPREASSLMDRSENGAAVRVSARV